MIDVGSFYSALLVERLLMIIFIVVLFGFFISIIICILNINSKLSKISMVIFISLFIAVFCSNVAFNTLVINNESEQLIEEIKATYNLSVDRDEVCNSLKGLKENAPSGKLFMKADNDSRIYEVYLIREGESVSLYTKNDKGVYLPITAFSAKTLESD